MNTSDVTPLSRELETYKRHQMDLVLSAEGKYVVISGAAISQPYDTYEEAIAAGYGQYGPTPFLVKQVLRAEPIYYFNRELP